MSSMLKFAPKPLLLLAGVSGVAIAAQVAPVQQIQGVQQALPQPPAPALPRAVPMVQPIQPAVQDPAIAGAIYEWRRLRQSDGYDFASYSRFLLSHPNWPGETAMRRTAERAIPADGFASGEVIAFFRRYPPLTAAGSVRYAEALSGSGQTAEAARVAREAWRGQVFASLDETRMIGRFPGVFTADDHDARMDMLLWNDALAAAQRQIAWTSPARKPLFEARLAYRNKAVDAAQRGAVAETMFRGDPGLIADKAMWYVGTGSYPTARSFLAQPRTLSTPPAFAEKWFELLLTHARAASADSQWATAYAIASQVDDAYPAGTVVSTRPLGERDDYTSLVWLAGTTALKRLNRPADAIGMFDRYARGAKSAQTQSKGLYWAGRAADAAGQRAQADSYYARAAAFADQFYGQLASERIGRTLQPPAPVPATAIDPATRTAFYARETVRAARWLGSQGEWQDQTAFLRQIASDATTGTDHLLASDLARSINRPDLGVMAGRAALSNGLSDYVASGFPQVMVPGTQQGWWTMIHAISRQESQFDRQATSRVGAKGLMQLMPGTAREQAGKLGMAYSAGALTDPSYNIQLGASYFARMLDYYGGSYPLAIAAYNAGPGNVNKFLRANGDPRTGQIEWIDWIEAIPLSETRGYVQRVLENAVVYDLMNPTRARMTSRTPLSQYLGKSRPG